MTSNFTMHTAQCDDPCDVLGPTPQAGFLSAAVDVRFDRQTVADEQGAYSFRGVDLVSRHSGEINAVIRNPYRPSQAVAGCQDSRVLGLLGNDVLAPSAAEGGASDG